MVAYHAPRFNNNILAVSELSTHVDVLFSDVYRPFKGCFMFQPGSRTILFETTCSYGLYKMPLSNTGASRSKRRESFSLAVAARVPQHQDAKMWHDKTGHPSAGRYLQLTKFLKNVPSFHPNVLQALECVPCIMAKAKQSSVRSAASKVDLPIEEINIDISGPFIPTINGEKYGAHFLDSRTAKSDVQLLKRKADFGDVFVRYIAYAHNHFAAQGFTVKTIRWDNAGENVSNLVLQYCETNGIKVEPSPPYAPERNGAAERIVQEHWMRARVLMFSSELPAQLWGEALKHANWLRNRLPASRIGGDLPILLWDSRTTVDFTKIPPFGQPGFSFIYRPKEKFQVQVSPCY